MGGIISQSILLFHKLFSKGKSKVGHKDKKESGSGDKGLGGDAKKFGGNEQPEINRLKYLKWDKKECKLVPCSREETNLDYMATFDDKGNLIYVPYPSNHS